MKSMPLRRRRRNRKRDLNAIRRAEIVRHAVHVGAMDTEDRERWLVAYALHNQGAKDQVWGVIRAAQKMGGEITKAEAIAIVDEADAIPHAWGADRLAKHLGLTYDQRRTLRIITIGSVDVKKRDRREIRRVRDKVKKEQKRRANGARPRAEYEANSITAQARAEGVSRTTIYRRKRSEQAKNMPDVTGVSAACLLSAEDGPVSPARGAGPSEGHFVSKKECPRSGRGVAATVGARRLSSSQTATTMAADIHASLPLELRLLALGLPMPEGLARAA